MLSVTKQIVGFSRPLRNAVDTADRYAQSKWSVLLMGETGVGKELFARRIHERSRHSSGPFIPVNCGALPPGLFESELFGHERGSFSGAQQSSRGLIRAAQGGTLFLDEIGDLDLSLQVKLLRLLDSGEVRSIGSQRVETVDIRVIAATNVKLYEAARKKKFRLDLLERLSVLTLPIPALRERTNDIALLAAHFGEELGIALDAESLQMLQAYTWPGNVRQLRNFVIRMSVCRQGKVSAEYVRQCLREEDSLACALEVEGEENTQSSFDGSLADIEKRVIVDRLRRCKGNRKRTARELGIAKSTLHEKLRRWKMEGMDSDILEWGGRSMDDDDEFADDGGTGSGATAGLAI